MAQIICQNLSVGYDSKIILENLSFEVNKGDYLRRKRLGKDHAHQEHPRAYSDYLRKAKDG